MINKTTGKARTLKACRAYFRFKENKSITDGEVKAWHIDIDFGDGEATGIKEVKSESDEAAVNSENLKREGGEAYDLQGRRVGRPTRGLYIINGKKIHIP